NKGAVQRSQIADHNLAPVGEQFAVLPADECVRELQAGIAAAANGGWQGDDVFFVVCLGLDENKFCLHGKLPLHGSVIGERLATEKSTKGLRTLFAEEAFRIANLL